MMRFSTFVAALLVPAAALAAEIVVKVGNGGALTFDPPSVTAQNGDTIAFQFLSKNHTVTQSTFAAPCTNISGDGLDSGFQFISPNATTISQYSFTLNNATGPLWFYCRQANHCQQGMVFAVNPTAEKSFETFQRTAMALGSVNPGNTTTGGSVPSGAPITAGSPSATAGSPSGSAAAATQGDSIPSETPVPNTAFKMSATSAVLFSSVGLVASLVL